MANEIRLSGTLKGSSTSVKLLDVNDLCGGFKLVNTFSELTALADATLILSLKEVVNSAKYKDGTLAWVNDEGCFYQCYIEEETTVSITGRELTTKVYKWRKSNLSNIEQMDSSLGIIWDKLFYNFPQGVANVNTSVTPTLINAGESTTVTYHWSVMDPNYDLTSVLFNGEEQIDPEVYENGILPKGTTLSGEFTLPDMYYNTVTSKASVYVSTDYVDYKGNHPDPYTRTVGFPTVSQVIPQYCWTSKDGGFASSYTYNVEKGVAPTAWTNAKKWTGNSLKVNLDSNNYIFFISPNSYKYFYVYTTENGQQNKGGIESVGQIQVTLYDLPVTYYLYRTTLMLGNDEWNIVCTNS